MISLQLFTGKTLVLAASALVGVQNTVPGHIQSQSVAAHIICKAPAFPRGVEVSALGTAQIISFAGSGIASKGKIVCAGTTDHPIYVAVRR